MMFQGLIKYLCFVFVFTHLHINIFLIPVKHHLVIYLPY